MTRDQLIRRLRRYARARGIPFEVDKTKGKGSHYWIRVGDETSLVQSELNPGRIERVLKQLKLDPHEF